MQTKEFAIPPQLSDNIQLIWGMASESPDDVFPRERILPDGIVELVFHFATPLRTIRADGSSCVQLPAFAISQMHEFIELGSTGPVGFIAVRCYPWGAHHFFDYPVNEFLDTAVSADQLWPGEEDAIESICEPNLAWPERCQRLTAFLSRQFQQRQHRDFEIDDAIKRIRNARGQLAVADVSRTLEISSRQLQRKFIAAVGTTPKIFARVSRFLHICRHMSDFRDAPLCDLALDCGFYDQSYFNREFKRFSGFTPKEFFEQQNVGYADL